MQEKTGLILNPYFSVFKLIWLIENVPAVDIAVKENRCMFGTIDSWLIWVNFSYYYIRMLNSIIVSKYFPISLLIKCIRIVCIIIYYIQDNNNNYFFFINRILQVVLMVEYTLQTLQMLQELCWWIYIPYNGMNHYLSMLKLFSN